MFSFDINAWQIMLDTLNKNYPDFDAKISFLEPGSFKNELKRLGNDAYTPEGADEACGFTFFDDDGKVPLIIIDSEIPCWASVEIIAHEAAHVIAGHKAEHGEKWETVFDKIHKVYSLEMEKIYESMQK